MVGTVILVAVALLILFWVVGAYNRLVRMGAQIKPAFAQVAQQQRRRHDLIPNLVETAKGTMKQEREALEAVIASRNEAVIASEKASLKPADAKTIQHMVAAEAELSSSLAHVLTLTDSYPELKTNAGMVELTRQLDANEGRIAFARQAYNDAAMDYNGAIEQFPVSIIAAVFAFKPAALLKPTASPNERAAVKAVF